MNDLSRLAGDMIDAQDSDDPAERASAEHRFIEVLTFSPAQDIKDMLDEHLGGERWLLMPVWARNLAFRLACLLEPNDAEIRQRAAADLGAFGPDWDAEVSRLEEEARAINESQQT